MSKPAYTVCLFCDYIFLVDILDYMGYFLLEKPQEQQGWQK